MSTQAIILPPLQWELNCLSLAWNEKLNWPLNAAGFPWSSSVSLMAARYRFEFYNGYMVHTHTHTHSWFCMRGHLLVCYSPTDRHIHTRSQNMEKWKLSIFHPRLKSSLQRVTNKKARREEVDRQWEKQHFFFFSFAFFCWFSSLTSIRTFENSFPSGSN